MFNDPRTLSNRPPTESELPTLRFFLHENRKQMEAISQQLKIAREKHEAASRFYQEQVLTLQRALSEMNDTGNLVNMLEGKRSLIQANLDQVESFIHPIRRCPLDILQEIFEWVVCTDENFYGRWSSSATRLSRVCKRWRTVALQTPLLWTRLWVPVGAEHDSIKSFFERSTQRLKTMKPTISLVGIRGTHAEVEAINLCQLDRFVHIECLEIRFHSPKSAEKFTTNVLHSLRLPVGPVDRLVICCTGFQGDPKSDVGPIIKLFPTISDLTLRMVPGLSLPAEIVMPNVRELKFGICSSVSLTSMAKSFPNLQHLSFRRVDIKSNDANDIEWVRLTSLHVQECKFPWSRLKTPSLKTIWFHREKEIDDEFLAFISRTPLLEHIDTNAGKANVILARTPNLVSLTTQSYDSFAEPPQIQLESLHNFRLLTLVSLKTPLSTEQFEKIVQNYFLPLSGVSGANTVVNRVPRLRELRILVSMGTKEKECLWRNSGLVSSVSEVSTYDKQRSDWFKCYCFQWK